MKIYFKGDIAPIRGSTGAAGWDVRANEDVELFPFYPKAVSTGIYVEIPKGFYLAVVPRSGLSLKGVTVWNAPGTIDEDYRGELKIILLSLHIYPIKKGDKIAQLILKKYEVQCYENKEALDETERNAGGFGSTGA